MSIIDRIFKKRGKETDDDRRSGDALRNNGRSVMPLALGMAGLNRFQGKPDSYVPLADADRVNEMAQSAAAALSRELDNGFSPSPFGSSHPDLSQSDSGYEAGSQSQSGSTSREPQMRQYHDGTKELTLQVNSSGSYLLNGKINNKPVKLLVDTGASQVSVPEQVAYALGLERTGRKTMIRTANGTLQAHGTELDELLLGEISLRFVPALINPGDNSDTILLGMSALKHLNFSHTDGKLILQQKPAKRRGDS